MKSYYFSEKTLRGYPWIEDELDVFSKCNKILDIGCGTGWFLKELGRRYPDAKILGIDVTNAIEFEGIDITISSGSTLPFKSQVFDGISCKAVLEHLPNPFQAVLEMNRVLKVGGVLFISVPDVHCRSFWDDYTHIRPYNKKSIQALLKDAGFAIGACYYVGGMPGMGIFMKIFNIKRIRPLSMLGHIPFFRNYINILAIKI